MPAPPAGGADDTGGRLGPCVPVADDGPLKLAGFVAPGTVEPGIGVVIPAPDTPDRPDPVEGIPVPVEPIELMPLEPRPDEPVMPGEPVEVTMPGLLLSGRPVPARLLPGWPFQDGAGPAEAV